MQWLTCSFTHVCTLAPVSLTQRSTRHCSVEQCTHTDRLMESNMNTDTYLHTPQTQEVLPHPSCFYWILHTYANQSIHSSLSHSAGFVLSFGSVPVFTVKHKGLKKSGKKQPSFSALALICCYSTKSHGEHFPLLASHPASMVRRAVCGRGYACMVKTVLKLLKPPWHSSITWTPFPIYSGIPSLQGVTTFAASYVSK